MHEESPSNAADAVSPPPGDEPRHAFRCNICGESNEAPTSAFGRELPSCEHCGSTTRMRSIIHALSTALFGESLAIADFPCGWPIKGIGLSDWVGYAERLPGQFDYANTFLHQEPRLDILDPPEEWVGTLDFVIATDVFEHVTPPVQPAFDQALRLLRPGGVLVFSVPYELEGETTEHFPELHEWRVEQEEGGAYVLHNRTRDGREELHRDLVFHGGPGQTLEMRVFTEPSLKRHVAAAGFQRPRVHAEDVPEFGILPPENWSLTWSARRPLTTAPAPVPGVNDVLFDQHSRYASVGRILSELAAPGGSVLDVGSGEARLLERYAPGLECSYLDPLLEVDEGSRVLAGGFERLATEERQWDWLVSVDTLEHIPESQREAFLERVLARARFGLVISGPCDEDEAAHDVDARVNAAYRAKMGRNYPWLIEHQEYGLPSRRWLQSRLEAAGFATEVFGNGHAPWLGFLLPYFVCYLDDPQHMQLLRELSELFNEHLYPFDHLPPHYRSIVVATREAIDPSRLLQDEGAEMQAQAAEAWKLFERELVSRSSQHADELAQRPPRLAPNPHAKQMGIQDVRAELAAVREELRVEKERADRDRARLMAFENSLPVRVAKRLGLIPRP